MLALESTVQNGGKPNQQARVLTQLSMLPVNVLELVLAVGTQKAEQVALVVAFVCHDLPNFPCLNPCC